MLFSSYSFILAFLPVTLLLYYGLGGGRPVLGKTVLAAASLLFYGLSPVGSLWLMLGSIAMNWLLSRLILSFQLGSGIRHGVLWGAVAANLGLLFLFKYKEFALGLLSGDLASHTAATAIPLGISFFTFTQIAFLADAHRRQVDHHTPLDYLLFVTVFPHLIAGPIIHHREMMPQFSDPQTYRWNSRHVAEGLTLFAMGLAKKVLLADTIAVHADPVFAAAAPTLIEAWCGALAYTFQIYYDFSGYSDMAVGLGLMLGLRLPINFASPYRAGSIIEFWRRWHISLSLFLRDYLYIPLGGSRKGSVRRHANLLVTMLLGGLWHGANLTFVAWGALHGVGLLINHAWRAARGVGRPPGRLERLAGAGLTLLLVVVGWVLFRANDLSSAFAVLRGMMGLNGVVIPESYATLPLVRGLVSMGVPARYLPDFHGIGELALLAAMGAHVTLLPNSQTMALDRQAPRALNFRPTMAWSAGVAILLAVGLFAISGDSPFLYFQF
ncbi:MBOAT family O-acyltransferase [Paramagnetospirillum magneticum]|uniref:Probable alginate O-acetylase AlgI n=1 Tax=Paramagnetospirillum magneticum (strain ATCC 700264 / AMB-1) TaxID=342108 RepID=Q2WB77_PARM1|nr:MBOAT family O-acyltransferase [Paramagnetospirillum magneticum]BAE48898.1 Probable poly(beta-D-mannuronate) O-acetylase [Paramagnetospirillum magneticum AMB-1]